MCHRDLKPDNIITSSDNFKSIKIIDFGIANNFLKIEKKKGIKNVLKKDMLTKTGTTQYKSPEMFGFFYTESVDMWALGIIVFELL